MQFPWHLGVFDAHCHPTDTLASLHDVPAMRARILTVMATRAQDQDLVAQAALDLGVPASVSDVLSPASSYRVVPAFGWHPWFSHEMSLSDADDDLANENGDETRIARKIEHYQSVLTPAPEGEFALALPEPRPLRIYLSQMRTHLEQHPLALVGEVGLDRSFRIPEAWLPQQSEQRDPDLTPGGREGRRLSPYRVTMAHQRRVLLAQLKVAGELQRAVSMHGVQAHGILYDTIEEGWKSVNRTKQEGSVAAFPPRICLHSFSGPADTVKRYIAKSVPCEMFFSFSTTINSWTEGSDGKVEAAVRAVPDDRLLVESDLHTAGEQMDACLEAAVRAVCATKGWSLDDGVRQLGSNWRQFVFGRRTPHAS